MPTATTADLLTILAALEREMDLHLRTGIRASPGQLVLWLHDVRLAAKTAEERES